MKCCLRFIPPLINRFMISGALKKRKEKKSALEETILDNVLCPQLVKHMSVALQHLDIAGKHMPTHLLWHKLRSKEKNLSHGLGSSVTVEWYAIFYFLV